MGNEEKTAHPETTDARAKRSDSDAGLCETCRSVRVQGTKRGARFFRCARADVEEGYHRYPPLPVLQCPGFERVED